MFGIYFSIYDVYEIEYLKKIEDFLVIEAEKALVEFKYGKGQRKTALQKYYEHINKYLTKLVEYQNHLETIGLSRNSYSRTDKDATFMHMKEDHMRNSQLKSGYNIQIGVSDEYILHLDIFNDRNDYNTLYSIYKYFF
ncbi:Transposase, fragment [Alteracholeplasma palmae J233]|uniref:Transposase n=1 Tax=Alteracholeplasma palmae (strain ATCC 49389 / J233) TaxID=1318466 RepID=U4KQ02_ALTPJ|nr:hypothetical protein [Alteracholeplasma palmae]CCV64380.1 Transposase, fragment [Alteracholeplasma palmae J233]